MDPGKDNLVEIVIFLDVLDGEIEEGQVSDVHPEMTILTSMSQLTWR